MSPTLVSRRTDMLATIGSDRLRPHVQQHTRYVRSRLEGPALLRFTQGGRSKSRCRSGRVAQIRHVVAAGG